MTEQPPVSQPVEVDLDEAFDAWLEGSAIPQRSVVVYAKPQLYARFQELERRMTALVKTLGKDGAQADPELSALEAEYQALYDEWMASKSTWFVHALSDDDREIIRHGLPSFDPLPADATDAVRAKRERQIDAGQLEANLRTIAAATVRIEFADRVLNMPPMTKLDGSAEALERASKDCDRIVSKLRGMLRSIGDQPVLNLMVAIAEASSGDPVIPAPKSQKQSDAAQA